MRLPPAFSGVGANLLRWLACGEPSGYTGKSIWPVLLKARAENAGVAQRIIANTEELEQLAENGENSGVPALAGWRHELFGAAALELLAGRLFIGFEAGKVSERSS